MPNGLHRPKASALEDWSLKQPLLDLGLAQLSFSFQLSPINNHSLDAGTDGIQLHIEATRLPETERLFYIKLSPSGSPLLLFAYQSVSQLNSSVSPSPAFSTSSPRRCHSRVEMSAFGAASTAAHNPNKSIEVIGLFHFGFLMSAALPSGKSDFSVDRMYIELARLKLLIDDTAKSFLVQRYLTVL